MINQLLASTRTNSTSKTSISLVSFFIVVAIIIDALMFKRYIMRSVALFYPGDFDQTSYLYYTYTLYENVKKVGILAAISNTHFTANSIIFPLQALFVFMVFGVSRANALFINYFYYLTLLIISFAVMKSLTKRYEMPVLMLGLLLLIKTPFYWAGGLSDFRIDFIDFCLYGVFIAAVMQSKIFLGRKWVIASTIIACWFILMRLLTLVYFAGIFAVITIYFLLKMKSTSYSFAEYSSWRKRYYHALLSGSITAILASLCAWFNRSALYDYYVIGHFLGDEKKIRAAEFGVHTFMQTVSFYFIYLFDHLSFYVCVFSLLLLTAYSIFYLRKCFSTKKTVVHHQVSQFKSDQMIWQSGFIFLLSCFFVPLVVLTADVNKSPIVASIMVTPFLWLIFWYCFYIQNKYSIQSNLIMKIFSILVLCIGITHHIQMLCHHPSKRNAQDLTMITKMYLDIGDYVTQKNIAMANLAADQLCDYLTYGGIAAVYFEQKGLLLHMKAADLAGTIFSINERNALTGLSRSDVFIMNIKQYHDSPPYPVNKSLDQLKPELKKYADSHFKLLHDYPFKGSTYRVYVK